MTVLCHRSNAQMETSKELLLSIVGLAVLSAGLGGFIMQLLTPLTILGSVNYVTAGSTLLLVNSRHARQISYSYVPTGIKDAIFEKSLLDTLRESAPHWQLLAFFVACVALAKDDAQALSKQLPPCFDSYKHRNIAQCIVGDNAKPLFSPASLSIFDEPEKSPSALITSVTGDPFTARVVEAGIRSVSKQVLTASNTQLHKSIGTIQRKIHASTSLLAWMAMLGIVGGSAVCWWQELLIFASNQDLWLSMAQKYLKLGMRAIKRITHADMSLLALTVASGSAAVLGTCEVFSAMGLPGDAGARIASVSTAPTTSSGVSIFEPVPAPVPVVSAEISSPQCAPAAISCEVVSTSSAPGLGMLCLLRLLRLYGVCINDTAVQDASTAVIDDIISTSSTANVQCRVEDYDSSKMQDSRNVVVVCAALLVLCARRLQGSLVQNRWVACAVYSKLCKGPSLKG